jgi:hypothetical protein
LHRRLCTTALLDMFDLIPLGLMMGLANELRGIVHQGHALAGMIYMLARQRQGGAPRVDQRIRASEAAKGRSTSARLCRDRKLVIGRQLLEAKASLPHGHFGAWLDKQEGLSRHMATQCMAQAREFAAHRASAATGTGQDAVGTPALQDGWRRDPCGARYITGRPGLLGSGKLSHGFAANAAKRQSLRHRDFVSLARISLRSS